MKIEAEVARRVKLVVFDVDGVLTDAGLYLGAAADGKPIELKRFDIQDGLGIKMLEWAGIPVAIVSGRVSTATSLRALELDVAAIHQDNGAQKVPALAAMLEARGLEWSEVAFLGDDLPDLAALRRVGLPAAVANAVAEVKDAAVWIAERSGGHGAAREFAEALLSARGVWSEMVERYVTERDLDE